MTLPYEKRLTPNARALRGNMTDAEQKLWQRLRRKQINDWQFYRQKPLGPYIVDFYCAAAKLLVEINGSQHFEAEHQLADQQRDAYLAGLGLRVLRFDNRQVLLETAAVVEMISRIPPAPPFSKGGVSQPSKNPVTTLVHREASPTPTPKTSPISPIPPFEKGG